MSYLVLDHLTRKFESLRAVDDLCLTVKQGEFVSLLGPSGCGKTTTLRMVAGFLEPTAGDIYVERRRMNDLPPHRRNMGVVFQSYALFPHMTVRENVAFGLEMRGVSRDRIRSRLDGVLELVGLQGLEGRYPRQLSGGQQQRVALARAVVISPSLLLLDEPLSSLDAKLRAQLRVELRRIQKEVGIATLFVTHDQEEALTLSDRVVVMRQGRAEQVDTPQAIFEAPATRYVADFMGYTNFLPGVLEATVAGGAAVRAAGAWLRVAEAPAGLNPGSQVTVAVRPEQVAIKPAGEPADDNELSGAVELVTYEGVSTSFSVTLSGGHRLLARTTTPPPLRSGDPVRLVLPPSKIRLFAE